MENAILKTLFGTNKKKVTKWILMLMKHYHYYIMVRI